jgi:hypothetical protein
MGKGRKWAMGKPGLFIGIALLSILTVLCGCQGGDGMVKASLNNEFSLAIGQSAGLTGEPLTIQFVEIQDDSRCPKGAMCIWQGRVSAVLQVSDGSDSTRIVLTEPGLSDQWGRGTYKKYELLSHVQPYPELGKQISKADYRILLTVKTIQAGSD